MERLSGQSWAQAFTSFRSSAFRWEAQGVYREPAEQGPMSDFLAGRKPDMSFMDGYLARVKQQTVGSLRYSRVRVLTEPLNDYLRFQLSFTHLNVEAGEDIRLLPEVRRCELGLPMEDFWLFDDEWAARMHFGDEGFTHADVVTDDTTLNRFREIRDLAWREAIPFADYG
ncbi:hypothetical protein FHX69_2890 [Prauserella muralis]|nr:hypothetical protein FHX69_2890 [Prauserella muralis]